MVGRVDLGLCYCYDNMGYQNSFTMGREKSDTRFFPS